MTVRFCIECGQERINEANFCANCGYDFSLLAQNNEAIVSSSTVDRYVKPINIKSNLVKTLPNIIVNVIVGFLLVILNSVLDMHVSWGGGESYLMTLLVLVIVFQAFALFLQKRRKSYTLLLPSVVSVISIFPTIFLYKDFQMWLDSQGYHAQTIAGGDLTLILVSLLIFIAITILNVFFIIKGRVKQQF